MKILGALVMVLVTGGIVVYGMATQRSRDLSDTTQNSPLRRVKRA